MRQNAITTGIAFLLILSLQITCALQGPPIELNRTNLNSYPFILVNAILIPRPNSETELFRVIVTPKDGHKPEHFAGILVIKERDKRIAYARVYMSTRAAEVDPSEIEKVPNKLRARSVAFEFEVSTSFLKASEFKLVESRRKQDDDPNVYVINLSDFADNK